MLVASNRQTKAPVSLLSFVFFLFIVIIHIITTLQLDRKKALIMQNFKHMVRFISKPFPRTEQQWNEKNLKFLPTEMSIVSDNFDMFLIFFWYFLTEISLLLRSRKVRSLVATQKDDGISPRKKRLWVEDPVKSKIAGFLRWFMRKTISK